MAVEKGNVLEHVFNVAMAPVDSFDFGDGRDISGAKGRYGRQKDCKQADQEQDLDVEV